MGIDTTTEITDQTTEPPASEVALKEREFKPTLAQRIAASIGFAKYVLDSPVASLFDIITGEGRYPDDFLPKSEEETIPSLEMNTYGHQEVIDLFSDDQSKNDESGLQRKLCIIMLGGGQAGSNGAGALLGIEDAGVLDKADGIISVSAGIPTTMYVKAKQGDFGATIYRDENTQGDNFFKANTKNPQSILNYLKEGPDKPIIDTFFVGRCMRETKPLDVKTLQASPTELLTVVMNVKTGKPKYIDLRHAKDPITLHDAGICVPGVSTKPSVQLEDGEKYADGAYADAIPLEEAFKRGYTDVLIIANSPLHKPGGFLGQLTQFVISKATEKNAKWDYGKDVTKAIFEYPRKSREAFEYVLQTIAEANPQRRVAVIAPNNGFISNLESSQKRLTKAFYEARDYTKQVFSTKTSERRIRDLHTTEAIKGRRFWTDSIGSLATMKVPS